MRDEIAKNTARIDKTNKWIDRLYEVIVRKEEHEKIELRVVRLEQDITQLKKYIK